MNVPTLTQGALERILQGDMVESPVFQILAAKKVGVEIDRMRLVISDGRHLSSYAMLAQQMNHLHEQGQLAENTVVRIDKYITSVLSVPDKCALIILELTVLTPGSEVNQRIGNPQIYMEYNIENNATLSNQRASLETTKNNPCYDKRFSASKRCSTTSTEGTEAKSRQLDNRSVDVTTTTTTNSNRFLTAANNTIKNQFLTSALTPIARLKPYQNNWIIRALVISKSQLSTFTNAKGAGKRFSMDLTDESCEIRATAFNEEADRFYNKIEANKIYYISKARLQPANKQYSQLKNKYELVFKVETVIKEFIEDASSSSTIPQIKYDLIKISEIANIENKSTIDTIGICKHIGELITCTSHIRRQLVLVDESNVSINLTLWGEEAIKFNSDVNLNPIIIIVKRARVNEFEGRKNISGGFMQINPDMPECQRLKVWFENGGAENIESAFKTEWLTFVEAKNLDYNDKPSFFQCKATIRVAKSENAVYKACPKCNKKVIDDSYGLYRCERCNSITPNFKYRFSIQMSIDDWTAEHLVTYFNEAVEQILDHSAQEIGLALENNSAPIANIFSKPNFKSYIFKLQAKEEIYRDTARLKMIIQSHAPVNYHEYNKYLINNLKRLTGIPAFNE